MLSPTDGRFRSYALYCRSAWKRLPNLFRSVTSFYFEHFKITRSILIYIYIIVIACIFTSYTDNQFQQDILIIRVLFKLIMPGWFYALLFIKTSRVWARNSVVDGEVERPGSLILTFLNIRATLTSLTVPSASHMLRSGILSGHADSYGNDFYPKASSVVSYNSRGSGVWFFNSSVVIRCSWLHFYVCRRPCRQWIDNSR